MSKRVLAVTVLSSALLTLGLPAFAGERNVSVAIAFGFPAHPPAVIVHPHHHQPRHHALAHHHPKAHHHHHGRGHGPQWRPGAGHRYHDHERAYVSPPRQTHPTVRRFERGRLVY